MTSSNEHSSTSERPRSGASRSGRARWAAVGAALAVAVGAVGVADATIDSGERAVVVSIEPCRLADTRPGQFNVGPRTAPLGPGEHYTLSGWGEVGECSLPSTQTALELNVTAISPTHDTYLTLYPGAGDPPNASNLNPEGGSAPVPNSVTVDLDSSGQFSIFNKFGNVHVAIDVVGYYEDHNHDDRYYTEAEVQNLLSATKPVLSGSSTGTILNMPQNSYVTVAQASLNAPGVGTVQVSATAAFTIRDSDTDNEVFCGIARTPTGTPTTVMRQGESNDIGSGITALSLSNVGNFTVTAPGTNTFYYRCLMEWGSNGTNPHGRATDRVISLAFFPAASI